jgi:hypothetical protein
LRLPVLLFAIAAVASGVLLLALMSRLTFFLDEWDILLHRRGVDVGVFLDQHNGHLIAANVAVYKALQATFGMDSLVPYAVASTLSFLTSVVLLFVYVRRRAGGWLALAFALPVLFMGSAFDDLLVPFQMCFTGAVACGIGALLLLDRGDRLGDAFACALLIASLLFSEIGLAFAAGITIQIALHRGPWRRAYIVALPALLYLLWYAAWGQQASDEISLHNLAESPSFLLDGLAASAASLLGLGTPILLGGTGGLDWGRPLLVGLVAATILRIRRSGRISPGFWATLAIAVSFWFLVASHAGFGRTPATSRYQYVGGVLLLLVAAELVRGWTPNWRDLVAVFAVVAAAVAGNLSTLHRAYQALHASVPLTRGDLAGLEIASATVDPELVLTPENSNNEYLGVIDAGSYLSAERKFGSPAYNMTELAAAPESARVAADKVLAAALHLAARAVGGMPTPRGPAPRLIGPAANLKNAPSCITVQSMGGEAAVVQLPPGGADLVGAPGVASGLKLRRYSASSFPIDAGRLRGAAVLSIPSDRSSVPWQLQVAATGPIKVCGRGRN